MDLEDEGDNRRDVYYVKEVKCFCKWVKGLVIFVEKMVLNGVENVVNDDFKFFVVLNENFFLKFSIFFVEEKEKYKNLISIFREGFL